MTREELLTTITSYGLGTREAYEAQAFSRNIGLLTPPEQLRLSNATVAIPGMGGVGGNHLITLVRAGVGRFHLSDFDTFEPANVNRQFGASVPNFGRQKLEVMKEQALAINPYLEIQEFPEGIGPDNVDPFLEGVDVLLDGLDFFTFDTRRLIFNRARDKGVYVITAGPMGFSSAMLVFSPHEGMSFDEFFAVHDNMDTQQKLVSFAIGLAPSPTHFKYVDFSRVDFEAKAGPSTIMACQMCSGMAAMEAVRIILKRPGIKPAPHYFQFDAYRHKFKSGRLIFGNRHPKQRIKKLAFKLMVKKKEKPSEPWPPEKPDVNLTSGDPIPEEVIRYIIRAGIQAPSGDNAQPWKFDYHGNTIDLYLDRYADQSFFNVQQIASIISCGAVLENMRIASTEFELNAQINMLPTEEKPHLMGSMELVPRENPPDPLAPFVWHRETNRKFYRKDPLDESIPEKLNKALTGFPGVKLHLVTEKKDLARLAKLVFKVDRIRTEHQPLHEHLMKMIRFTPQEAENTRDGLPLKNLEGGFSGEMFLKIARPWWVMNIFNKLGLGRMVAFHAHQGLRKSSGAGLLTVSGMTPRDFLEGGRTLERLWLILTCNGLAMQPMTAITLFWMRWKLERDKGFSEKHRKLLKDVWEEYKGLFREVDFSKEGHVMLFRLGYASPIRQGTYRNSLPDLSNPSQDQPDLV